MCLSWFQLNEDYEVGYNPIYRITLLSGKVPRPGSGPVVTQSRPIVVMREVVGGTEVVKRKVYPIRFQQEKFLYSEGRMGKEGLESCRTIYYSGNWVTEVDFWILRSTEGLIQKKVDEGLIRVFVGVKT